MRIKRSYDDVLDLSWLPLSAVLAFTILVLIPSSYAQPLISKQPPNITSSNPVKTPTVVSNNTVSPNTGKMTQIKMSPVLADKHPQISVSRDGKNLYVVWERVLGNKTSGPFGIIFKRSTDGGGTFAHAIALSRYNAVPSVNPQIAVSGDGRNVYVIWEGATANKTSGPLDVFIRRSIDGGATLGKTIALSRYNLVPPINPEIAALVENRPQIAVSENGSSVYVVWEDKNGNKNGQTFNIFFKRSTDGGATFAHIIDLSTSIGASTTKSRSAPTSQGNSPPHSPALSGIRK